MIREHTGDAIDRNYCANWLCLECQAMALRGVDEGYECDKCHHVYSDIEGIPTFIRDPERHRKFIEAQQAEKPLWYLSKQDDLGPWAEVRRVVDAKIADLLRRNTRPGMLALDLGCGDGRNLEKLRNAGLRCVGTDYNVVRLRRAEQSRKSGGYDLLFMSDVTDLPIPSRQFDVVYFDQVLEHIPQPGRVLSRIRQILKDSGVLFLGVPNEGSWYYSLKFKVMPSLLKKTDHVNFFTERTLRDLLVQNSFTVAETVGMVWGLPASGRNLLAVPTKLDGWLRHYRWYNRLWDAVGRRVLPGQFFELYMVCRPT